MKIIATDDRGIAVLRAAGLPCQEFTLNPTGPSAQPKASDTHPKAGRLMQWRNVKAVKMGIAAPDPRDQTKPAWAYRATVEELTNLHMSQIDKANLGEYLLAAHELHFKAKTSNLGWCISTMLDKGWMVPA